jgi:amino acid transporter
MSRWQVFKQALFGKPIATKHAHAERLSKRFGLPVMASDALSSVAYATEEVMLILVLAGAAPILFGSMPAYYWLLGICMALVVLMGVIVFSYYQTIHAYPDGGGSYSVSRSNLGPFAGKVAGAALLIDYILTVAVSVSAGTAALVSAFPDTQPYMVPIAVLAVLLLMYANLRGARESGIVFAIPTYTFIVSVGFMILWGVGREVFGMHEYKLVTEIPEAAAKLQHFHEGAPSWINALPFLFLLKAFSASCAALTGVEAISNGVQAFKKPEAKNASMTLVVMAVLLAFLFTGVSWCAQHYAIMPMHSSEAGYQTVLAQLAAAIFGEKSFGFYVIQLATVAILFLAANTAFVGFPRLGSLIAEDGLLPRFLMGMGDRLVYNNGILLLSGVAMALIVAFRADTHMLVPLYAVGVFTAFTMSQAGMVAYWNKRGIRDWRKYLNGLGMVMTGVVTIVLSITKFQDGAWVTVFAVAAIMAVFWGIQKHYARVRQELVIQPGHVVPVRKTVALLLVPRMHRGVLEAIAYAKSLTKDVRALHVTIDAKSVPAFKEEWTKFGSDLPMVVLESPYRSLIEPILDYIDATLESDPTLMVTVIVPQGVAPKWWHKLLHNNAAHWLKRALGTRERVVVTNVRYFLK